jgi:hypothetical protein
MAAPPRWLQRAKALADRVQRLVQGMLQRPPEPEPVPVPVRVRQG